MSFEVSRTISSEHPSLPGHFPDRPIVPAVVILDEVIGAVAEWRGADRVTKIGSVKFLAPLQPDQMFSICLHDCPDAKTIDFVCQSGSRDIVQGRLLVERRSS